MVKNKNNKFYYSFFYKIFFISLFVNILSEKRDNDYPLKYRLNNGNYIVIIAKGIYIYNPNFSSKIIVKSFDTRIVDDDGDAYLTNVAQFLSEDDGYIICFIVDRIYLISKNGILLTNYTLDYITSEGFVSYEIIPYGHLENEYYFMIITKVSNDIKGRKYKYDSINNLITLINDEYSYTNNNAGQRSISCRLMNYLGNSVISCFYGSWDTTFCTTFNITDFSIIMEKTISSAGGQIFKSNVNSTERTKAACCSSHEGDLICYSYNIDNNTFGEVKQIVSNRVCDCQPIDLMVEYFPERGEFIFWCVAHYDIYIARFSKEDNFTNFEGIINLVNNNTCDRPKRFNLFYNSESQKYTVLTDTDCQILYSINSIEATKINDFPADETQLICENYTNYEQTQCFGNIPIGYFHNDSTSKIIYQCHEYCETCKEGPTNDNNNCLSCKNSKYLDLGNCVSICNNGNFTDEDNINKCKCSINITCKYCSKESKNYNLCVSCNNEEGYYPKIDDQNNIHPYINCYNNQTISNGYYLNISTGYYEKCYETCNKCNELGDENNNKCTECISTHEFKSDFDNDFNCYQKCDKYYYFDSSKKYYCVDNCTEEYSNLLGSRCVDNCSRFDNYKYEFNKKCYNKCPSLTHISEENDFICIADLICPKYYSYDLKNCIEEIPKGYYCNDTDLNTIDKCHENCETCKLGPTDINNNCLTCNNSKYLDLGNCVDNCTNGYFLDSDNITKCKCTNNNKCLYCNETSLNDGLCISCNHDEGFYQKSDDEPNNNLFVNCHRNPEGYYLDITNKIYKPCFYTCKTCNIKGDEFNNNCQECNSEYEFKHDFDNDKNCYKKCNNYYYFDSSKIYNCTDGNNCPLNYKLIIPKKKCIDDCSKDKIYRYEYQNICYEACPNNTISLDNNFICKEITINEENCKLSQSKFTSSKNDVTINDLKPLTEKYANNYYSSNDYVSTYDNKYISIYIYKNISCLEQKTGSAPKIDFGECYKKVKTNYDIKEDLIISIININSNPNTNAKPITTYAFSNPITGDILNSSKICENEKIVVEEDVKFLLEYLDEQKENILSCVKQGIDVFNKTNEFYHDLCYHFESPNGRDIPLEDRISMFYPNVTLCDEGCDNKGVDLKTLKAICICTFNDLNNHSLTQQLYSQYIEEVFELVTSLNIAVVQCIKDIFVREYFIKCAGGFIFLGLFLCHIICLIIFLIDGLYYIRKFLFSLTESYSNYMYKNNNKQNMNTICHSPIKRRAKKKLKKLLSEKSNGSNLVNSNKSSSKKELKKSLGLNGTKLNYNSILSSKSKFKTRKKINYNNQFLKTGKIGMKINKVSDDKNNLKSNKENISDKIDIQEYLSESFDENDFDDVVYNDKRSFCKYFLEKIMENQIIITTFYIKESLRPRALKIMVFIKLIEVIFVINALFYTEDYLRQISNLKEKDSFFDFVPRRLNHFIYIYLVIGIFSYLMGFFFIEEKKIKKIFLRNKEGEMKIKYEISLATQDIHRRFKILIILCFVSTIIFFIYISCFNIVYPNTKIEWIKSTIFIFITTQIINVCWTFAECCIRYIAIRCNSDKLFKLSLIFE